MSPLGRQAPISQAVCPTYSQGTEESADTVTVLFLAVGDQSQEGQVQSCVGEAAVGSVGEVQ